MSEKKILLVEDDRNIQRLLSISLTKAGFTLLTANNGFEGLAALDRERPDLIITDIMMPELDGLSLLKAIQFREDTKDIPIIILSARDSIKDVQTGLETGARFYLTKPFKLNELMGQIKFIFSRVQ